MGNTVGDGDPLGWWEVGQRMGTWRESRVLLVMVGLAVLGTVPGVLRAPGVTNGWVVGGATVGAGVGWRWVARWQERYKSRTGVWSLARVGRREFERSRTRLGISPGP